MGAGGMGEGGSGGWLEGLALRRLKFVGRSSLPIPRSPKHLWLCSSPVLGAALPAPRDALLAGRAEEPPAAPAPLEAPPAPLEAAPAAPSAGPPAGPTPQALPSPATPPCSAAPSGRSSPAGMQDVLSCHKCGDAITASSCVRQGGRGSTKICKICNSIKAATFPFTLSILLLCRVAKPRLVAV